MRAKCKSLFQAAAFCFCMVAAFQTEAVVLTTNPAITDSIIGVATFDTHGERMSGMTVEATFRDVAGAEYVEKLVWGDIGLGPDSGGVASLLGVDGWRLSLTGDSYSSLWSFENWTGYGLIKLELDGRGGFVLFDRATPTSPYTGTPDSERGKDFVENPSVIYTDPVTGQEYYGKPSAAPLGGLATYSRQVAINGFNPVGDIWHVLTIDFTSAVYDDWTFIQDTDNDKRRFIPEPAGVALIGLGLVLLIATRRFATARI